MELGAEVGIVDTGGVASLKVFDIAAEEGDTNAADLQTRLATGTASAGPQ
jgi:hypothetical protein